MGMKKPGQLITLTSYTVTHLGRTIPTFPGIARRLSADGTILSVASRVDRATTDELIFACACQGWGLCERTVLLPVSSVTDETLIAPIIAPPDPRILVFPTHRDATLTSAQIEARLNGRTAGTSQSRGNAVS